MVDTIDIREKESSVGVLRHSAENKLRKSSGLPSELAEKTPEEIVHELHVHQIELEMQNEELKRTQLELEDSSGKYRELYDFAPVGYFTTTNRGIIKEVNLSLAKLLGVSRQNLVNRGFGHFIDSESLGLWDIHVVSVLKQEEKQSCDVKIKREDGSSLYVRLESIRIDGPAEQQVANRETHRINVSVTDITERKQVEERNLSLAAIVDSSDDAIIGKTLDGTITSWNKGAERIYGYKEHEVVGKPITILSPT